MKPLKMKKKFYKLIGERWSFRKKTIIMSITMMLVFGVIGLVYFYVMATNPIVLKKNIRTQITNTLLEINGKQDPLVVEVIAETIIEACDAYNIPHNLYISIIEVESGAKRYAVNSSSGAKCLTQLLINDKKLVKLGLKGDFELYHIKNCIGIGAQIFDEGMQKDGTIKTALFHYNGVKKNIDDGNRYVATVLSKYYDRECK